jgi:hypothetical protein
VRQARTQTFSTTSDKWLTSKGEFKKLLAGNDDTIKIAAIKMLLKNKGDTRINHTWSGYTDSLKQHRYNMSHSTEFPDFSYATNQFVSLYLISAIYYSDTKFCSIIEIEYPGENGQKRRTKNLQGTYFYEKKTRYLNSRYEVVDSEIIEQIYSEYERWFDGVEKNGISNSPPPLEGTSFQWIKFN